MTSRRAIHITGWSAAFVVGLRHVLHQRFNVIGDGVSYLDIGDAFAHGEWASAINAYWSPLYAWLLGLLIRVVSPSPYGEIAVIAAFNFLMFVFALAAFTYLLNGLVRDAVDDRRRGAGDGRTFPEWAWLGLGYSVFLWVSLQLMPIGNVAPDMAVTGVVYLAAGLLVRMRAGATHWSVMCAFGATLGIGYLVKAPMFPLAPVFLICAALAIGSIRRAVPRVAVAALVFALIAGPFVVAISLEKGRFTFGESGRINVAWNVNEVPRGFWEGGPPRSGTPIHPPRRIHTSPDVFEFARPIRAAYPPWHDPSYWYDGVTPYVDLQGLKNPWDKSITLYRPLLRQQLPFVVGVLVLYGLAGGVRRWVRDVFSQSHLWIAAGAGLAMFTIAGAEGRYIGPFVVLLMIAALATVRVRRPRFAAAVLAGAAIISMVSLDARVVKGALLPNPARETTHINFEIASQLEALGVRRGDRVALMRPARGTYWARLAGVQIVAEFPTDASRQFWLADDETKQRALAAVAGTNARVLVTSLVPADADATRWKRLGETGWFACQLRD